MPATKQLFDLAINGDEDAIAYLWKESQTVVVPLARAWSKNKKLRSLYDHEDLVAEIYCAWRKNLDRMQWCGCNQFFAYTKILSQSHCRDLVRSEQAQKRGG
ncbi:MAG: hypothetical protein HOM34_04395, partial [Planctomycetes bacterium]|nr:hypothetical protein [Planctomycetota bacterium]